MKANCVNIRPLLIDYLDKSLPQEKENLVMEHLRNCGECSSELEQLLILFADMRELPEDEPSHHVKENFYAFLKDEEAKATSQTPVRHWKNVIVIPRMVYRIAAAFALFITGISLGLLISGPGTSNPEQLTNLQSQISELQRTVILARLDQESPSQRILAASSVQESGVIDESIIDALISTMESDENVNVRMSAMHALFRYRELSRVKDALIGGLEKQTDPVLQITLINMMVEMQEDRAIKYMENIIQSDETIPAVKDMAEKGIQTIRA